MSEHGFDSAPDMGNDFAEHSSDSYETPLDYDAQDWEPMEEPSEKHLEMHFTPGGSLEQEVHTQIDQSARERIIEAQNKQQAASELPEEKDLDFSGDFENARRNAWGWDPESQQEYDAMLEQLNEKHDNDVFETGRRFHNHWEQERCDDEFEH